MNASELVHDPLGLPYVKHEALKIKKFTRKKDRPDKLLKLIIRSDRVIDRQDEDTIHNLTLLFIDVLSGDEEMYEAVLDEGIRLRDQGFFDPNPHQPDLFAA